MKVDKYFESTYTLIIGIGITILSFIILIGKKWLYINLVNLFLIALMFLSIKDIISFFYGNKKKKKINYIRSLSNLILCIIFSIYRNIPLSILPFIFGIYLILNSLIKIINLSILTINKSPGKLTEFILILIYYITGILCTIAPLSYLDFIIFIIGIYLLLLGITYIWDFIYEFIPIKYKNKIKKRTRLTLPVLLEAIIPYVVLNEINYIIDKKNMDKDFMYEENKEDIKPDIEFMVHISNRGYNRLGHCDIVYKNNVIAYGSYDINSLRYHGLVADGVVFVADKEKYISFCVKHSKKMIFSFGLKLTDKQKENIEKEINLLFDNLKPWKSPYEEDISKNKKIRKKDYNDYASCLYMATSAKMYKFIKGKYKKYFAVGNNCVKLADEIISKSGIDALKIYGIITPGAYYEYLNREFRKKNSIVVSRKIYNNKSIKKVS